MHDVDFQFEVVRDIPDIVEEAGEGFAIILWDTPRVVSGNLHLFLTQDSGADGDSLQCEGKVAV